MPTPSRVAVVLGSGVLGQPGHRAVVLYVILDVYSRKIVDWQVHDTDRSDHAVALLRRTALPKLPSSVLHGDNGTTMKAATVLAMPPCCTGWLLSHRTRGPCRRPCRFERRASLGERVRKLVQPCASPQRHPLREARRSAMLDAIRDILAERAQGVSQSDRCGHAQSRARLACQCGDSHQPKSQLHRTSGNYSSSTRGCERSQTGLLNVASSAGCSLLRHVGTNLSFARFREARRQPYFANVKRALDALARRPLKQNVAALYHCYGLCLAGR